jgi:hygromycin-B 7''-O-kinase
MPAPPPITAQPHYGEHLGDVGYWSTYVAAALDRHGLPHIRIEAPFVGTFPTFLAGDVVVKLFGDTFDGAQCFATEKAMHDLLATTPKIPAPQVVAAGQLFERGDQWHWPYLITERLTGTAVRDLPGSAGPTGAVAATQLGEALAHLHALPPPPVVAARDPLPALRAEAAHRQRGFGLPDHLADQVPDFLADASQERVLVHADVTADHVFVDSDGMTGIIDWGDAITADPWYELVAVRFDALRCDPVLFTRFLDGYGWTSSPDFAMRALQGVVEFQFDAITTIAALVDLERIPTLPDLADELFGRWSGWGGTSGSGHSGPRYL